MDILITGIDGYIGWPLAMHLALRGHNVSGIDNLSRRSNVLTDGSWSATPISNMESRTHHFREEYDHDIKFHYGDITDNDFLDYVFKTERPDAVVHLGEIPSAPFSMANIQQCNHTQVNNIVGTNNILWAIKNWNHECHLLKLGTMGEYGTPGTEIPEGDFELRYRGRYTAAQFPRSPGSFYHASKVADSVNIDFACRIWGIRSTDIMQGVVHGILTDEMTSEHLLTRFDFDAIWGTAINRFCAQATIGYPMTVYGAGGQTRGYIALRDSIQCLTLALENPPRMGEYRVFNQFDECYNINQLASHVYAAALELELDVEIGGIDNPRVEAEEHFYSPHSAKLRKLGFRPIHTLDDELQLTFGVLMEYAKRIRAKREALHPRITWK
jgi:nucleoside-diphosphate-sugar epimerase